MIDMILQEAEKLGMEERRELVERLKVMVLEELRGPGADPASCPRCHHAHVVRKGKDPDGTQRWLCRGCGRTFSRKTMGLLAYSKLRPWQWARFVELACRHAPLSECARECGVSDPTAHFMRMRLCELMEAATPAFRSGRGVSVQVDGCYLNESLSGVGLRGGRMPREAHRTGKDVRERGISNSKVCVACGTNDLGDCFLSLCARGKPGADDVRESLSGMVCEGTDVATDALQAYGAVLGRMRVGSHRVYPSDGSAGRGLGDVDALHKRLRDFLGPMNGVSTRWLPHYLAWFRWEEHVRRSDASREAALSELAATGAYGATRRELYGGSRPYWDHWEGALPVEDVVDAEAEWGPEAAA